MEAVAVSWVWCLHCGEAHSLVEWEEKEWRCPTKRCDGWEWDAIPWEAVRKVRPEYPEVPAPGVIYPLERRQGK